MIERPTDARPDGEAAAAEILEAGDLAGEAENWCWRQAGTADEEAAAWPGPLPVSVFELDPFIPPEEPGWGEVMADAVEAAPGEGFVRMPRGRWLMAAFEAGLRPFRRLASAAASGFLRAARMVLWCFNLPGVVLRWTARLPGRAWRRFAALPWREQLAVRKGFLVGALAGFALAGSTLWALSSIPYISGHAPSDAMIPRPAILPAARFSVPPELAWFFIQFPYVSESAAVRSKNRHTFVVSDGPRRREYVVIIGQRYRRVEIYSGEVGVSAQVQVFTPGSKRTVLFDKTRIVSESVTPEANLWMWRAPLWNATHLKIYGLADQWLDSPYKRYSCAGFVHKFLGEAGIRIPIRDAWDMARLPWVRIPADEMEPGDIITLRAASREHRRFWRHAVTHVGVYIGHGKMIHASTASRRAARAFIRVADVEDFKHRIDRILRPPDLL